MLNHEESEKLTFNNQTFDNLTRDWFMRLNQSEKVFKEQESDLMNYEL